MKRAFVYSAIIFFFTRAMHISEVYDKPGPNGVASYREWKCKLALTCGCLRLEGQTGKNLRSLACKFELDQSKRKSSQVHAKSWPNGVAS